MPGLLSDTQMCCHPSCRESTGDGLCLVLQACGSPAQMEEPGALLLAVQMCTTDTCRWRGTVTKRELPRQQHCQFLNG